MEQPLEHPCAKTETHLFLHENPFFKNMLENLQLIAVILDVSGNITFCNEYLLKLTGWHREEVMGKNWFTFFLWDAPARNTEQIIANKQLPQHHENHIITRNNAKRLVKWSNTFLSNTNETVSGVVCIGEDITEKRHVEEELIKSNERLQVFFHQSLDGFFFCHFDHPRRWKNAPNKEEILEEIINTQRFTDVNDAMLKQYNISREDFLRLTTRDVFAHDLEQGRKLRRQLFDNGQLHLETHERKSDGTPIWFEGDYVCLYDKQGGITGFFGIQRDITDRKKSEQALRESEERYRGLFSGMLDGVYRSSPEGRFHDVNPAMVHMFGYENREEMLNIDIREALYFSPEDREDTKLNSLNASVDVYRMKKKDGAEIWVEDHGRYVRDEQGGVLYHEGILRDVTERKRAEEALIEAKEKYSSIFENAMEGIYQSSPEGKFITVNPAFARMLGFDTPQEMIETITDIAAQIYGETSQRINFMSTLEKNGSVEGFEYQMKRKDGSIIWGSENARVVKNSEGKILYYEGIVEDITSRKMNEHRIDKQLRRLNALHAIDNAINSSTDLRTTLDVLLKEVIAQLKVDAASVLLFNRNTLTLDYTASRGFYSKATKHTRLGPSQGFAGQVLLDRKTIHIPNLHKAENKSLVNSLSLAGEKFTAYVGAPLVAKGQTVGVLEIFQREPLAPDAEWFDFLAMLAGQTAIAVDNAQLFENLQRSNFELTLAYDATIEGWSRALDLRDKETEGHTQRVTTLTMQLAHQMGIPPSELLHIRRGALLHDIGKMGIPDNILHKPNALTQEEWEIMRRHTIYANEMLSPIPYLRAALDIPKHHHEKWDGSGYPNQLKGAEIPLPARIFSIVDVWDAITSDRPYRAAWSKEKAVDYIKSQSGKHFEPEIVNAFLRLVDDDSQDSE